MAAIDHVGWSPTPVATAAMSWLVLVLCLAWNAFWLGVLWLVWRSDEKFYSGKRDE